jgi:hypothetical protein
MGRECGQTVTTAVERLVQAERKLSQTKTVLRRTDGAGSRSRERLCLRRRKEITAGLHGGGGGPLTQLALNVACSKQSFLPQLKCRNW